MQIRFLALLLLSFPGLLAGCTPRPDGDVLVPAAYVQGARVVSLHTVTDRGTVLQARPGGPARGFTDARAATLSAARFSVSIPPKHAPGAIEWPGRRPDPATDMAVTARQDMPLATLVEEIAQGPGRADVRVFVHGYNTSFQEGLFRLAQITHDSGSEGAAILFAWPSNATVTGYAADREAATYARDHLAGLLVLLAQDRRIDQVSVLGHSMGSWLVMEALRQLRLGGDDATLGRLQVVLAAPDIDVDVFRAQLDVVGRLTPPLTVLVAPDDRALRISARLNAGRPRVGALDVGDPRMAAAAKAAGVTVIDITDLQSPDAQNHGRYAVLAAMYSGMRRRPGEAITDAGAFVLERTGAAVASPFILIAEGLQAGQGGAR